MKLKSLKRKFRNAQVYNPYILERFLGQMREETPLGRVINFGFWLVWKFGRHAKQWLWAASLVKAPVRAIPVSVEPQRPVLYVNTANADLWYDDATPVVSIVILNFNKADLTLQCLASLWEHTIGYKYEIIVVDNGSAADDFATLAEHHGRSSLIRLEANRFFGEGNNIGAEQARGEFLIFMNNDVTVTADWLRPLMQPFDEHEDCGATGPKFVYPDGRLQEAGALIDTEGFAIQLGKFEKPDDPRFNQPRTVDYVSAATVVMRRKTFDAVLGFDLMWEPAYYEDSDLCLKIRLLGLKTHYCPLSTVVHHENATSSDTRHGLKLNNIVEINRTKFVERWGSYLRGEADASPDVLPPPAQVRHTPKTRSRAVLYTPYNIIPGGGERYLLTIAEALRDQYEVWLVTPEKFSHLRLQTVARELDLDLSALRLASLYEVQNIGQIDLFVAMGNEVVPPIPGMGRRNIFHCQFPFPVHSHELARRWAWMEGYERLVVNSPFTQGHVQAQIRHYGLPERPVDVAYPPVESVGVSEDRIVGKDPAILHVGRFFAGGHCKRQDLLIEAFRDHIHARGIEAELHFVGSLHPEAEHRDYFLKCQALAKDLPIRFHLNASPKDMKDLYRRASVYWHATGLEVDENLHPEKTEHFGITIGEAMSAACIPVVLNKGGPRHIVAHGRNGFRFDTVEELAEHTIQVLAANNAPETIAMRRAALAGSVQFSKNSFMSFWKALAEEPLVEMAE